MKYDAFISYRHAPLDMEIAKKVHTGLETYHVPGAVRKKTGKKKIQRVFRDQEELPIGSDLNDNISGALAQSEYLIVICSPRTPESYWVCKEIESFIQMHDRDHVLAVLIEGEPDQSFPPLLLTDENGNPVEPLAADIRGETAKERNKKFKTEILRLAAPVLGCSYDDLRQRHRERIIKRTIAMVASGAAVLALAGTAFGLYNAVVAKQMEKLAGEKSALAEEKTMLASEMSILAQEKSQLADEILLEYKDKQKNQSRFFAEKSLSLLSDGYREDAALVAMAALPSDENDRPYVPEGEYALSKALYAYAGITDLDYDRILSHDMLVKDAYTTYDKKYFIAIDQGENVYVWDTSDWSLRIKIPFRSSSYNYILSIEKVYADETGVVVSDKEKVIKYDYDGNEIYSVEPPKGVSACTFSGKTGRGAYITEKGEKASSIFDFLDDAFSEKGYEVVVFDIKDGKETGRFDVPESTWSEAFVFSPDGEKLLIMKSCSVLDEAEDYAKAYLCSISTGEVKEFTLSGKSGYKVVVTEEGYFIINTLKNSSLYSVDNEAALDVIDPVSEKMLWSRKIQLDERSYFDSSCQMSTHVYEVDGIVRTDLAVVHGYDLFVFDENTGDILAHTPLSTGTSGLVLYKNDPTGLIEFDNGLLQYFSTYDGSLSDNTLDTKKGLDEIYGCNSDIILKPFGGSDLFIINKHTASDVAKLADTSNKQYLLDPSGCGDFFLTENFDEDSFYIYGLDGKELYRFEPNNYLLYSDDMIIDNKYVFLDKYGLHIVDPFEKTREDIKYTDDSGEEDNTAYGMITENGKYAIAWKNAALYLISVEERKIVYSLKKDYQTNNIEYIENAAVSEDGKTIYAFFENTPLTKIDVQTGEMSAYENEDLFSSVGVSSSNSIVVSPDGKYVAAGCFDGKVRVIESSSGNVIDEIPEQVNVSFFMVFTRDSKHLLLQGNDRVVNIRNIEEKCNAGTIDAYEGINNVIFDDANGVIALCTSRYVYLIENETFVLVADAVNNGTITYVPAAKAFVLSDTKGIWKIGYKDYRELIEEAKKQFPGAELTEEKKIRYNID